MNNDYVEDYLMHYGVKGQKWGIRNYQNPDGTLTPEGRIHYAKNSSYAAKVGTRTLKTIGQTALAYMGPAVAAGAVIAGAILANPAISAIAVGQLFEIGTSAAIATGAAGAGVSVVANGVKLVKDMLGVKESRKILQDDEELRNKK